MADFLSLLVSSFLLILPAFIANSVPVLAKGKHPIDFGRSLADGKRILGDGKTFEGFATGLLIGTLSGIVIGYALPLLYPIIDDALPYMGSSLSYAVPAFLLSLGALVGDIVGAFIKRRLGIARGAPAPVLDQLDFVVGALIFVYPVLQFSIWQAIFIVVVTPPIHLFTNYMAYRMKLKSHPW